MGQKLEDEKADLLDELSVMLTEAGGIEQQAVRDAITDRLRDVDAAIERIVDGTYGVTAAGEEIPEEVLRSNPAITTLIDEFA